MYVADTHIHNNYTTACTDLWNDYALKPVHPEEPGFLHNLITTRMVHKIIKSKTYKKEDV